MLPGMTFGVVGRGRQLALVVWRLPICLPLATGSMTRRAVLLIDLASGLDLPGVQGRRAGLARQCYAGGNCDQRQCPAAVRHTSPHSHWLPLSLLCATRPSPSRSEEHTSELQSLMRISYAVLCLKKKKYPITKTKETTSKTNTHIHNK